MKVSKYKTSGGPKTLFGKQTGHDVLPSRHAMSSMLKGSPSQRSLSNYAKMSPLDANGVGAAGLGIMKKPTGAC